jgi:hypothetical protein
MRLITEFELSTRRVTELHVLFRITAESNAKKRGEPNAAATLTNIKAAINTLTR